MKKGLSQEWLKLLACVTMLADHIGAIFYPGLFWLRGVGRLAFPIYCFLLVQGERHTKGPVGYGLRLMLGALVSEPVFDHLFYGGATWQHQSVMVTLLIGYGMLRLMRIMKKSAGILLLAAGCLAAELCNSDYGGWGVTLIWLLAVTPEDFPGWLSRIVGMGWIFWTMDSVWVPVGGYRVPVQMFGLLAVIPMLCYSGKKSTRNPWVQLVFYLFYPLHLAILLLVRG